MNPPRPSLADRRSDDPRQPSESGYTNSWIYQKNCYLCTIPLGYGQHRQKKLYCRQCRRAICLRCSIEPPTDKETICSACGKSDASAEGSGCAVEFRTRPSIHGRLYPSEDLRLVMARDNTLGRSATIEERSPTTADGVLRSAKSVLEELKRPNRTFEGEKGPGLLSRLQAKLTGYETELVDVKRQVGMRAEQLDSRDACVDTMTEKMQILAQTNSQLEQRVAQLEKAIEHLSEKGSEINSTTEAKADVCMHCSAF